MDDLEILKQMYQSLANSDDSLYDSALTEFYKKLIDRAPEEGFELLVADKDISELEDWALRLLCVREYVTSKLKSHGLDGYFYHVNLRGKRFCEIANGHVEPVVTKMHDSGKRTIFETGAIRDSAEGKPRIDLVSPFAIEKLAEWLTVGAEKYGDRNWEMGIGLERSLQSLLRHLVKFQQGVEDGEDHLVAVFCNAMFMIHTRELCNRGVLPKSLLDLPNYSPKNPNEENA